MSNESIKQKLHKLVDIIEDEQHFSMLSETAKEYVTEKVDIIDMLTTKQKLRLEEVY
jgi:Lhr-like helicase